MAEGGPTDAPVKSGFVRIWFPLLHFFSVNPILRLVVLGCFLIRPGLIRNSERPDFPTFAALGKGIPALRNSIRKEVEGWLPLLPEVALPRLTGQVLADVVQRKGATAGSLDGRVWRELKVLPVAWYDGLARILTKVEEVGVWPDGLLDAYIAMIPKTDGDALPLARGLSVFSRSSIVCGLQLVWVSLRIGLGLGCLIRS